MKHHISMAIYLTVVSDARTVALLGQFAGVGRFLQRQGVAVRGVFDGDPFAFRDFRLVLCEFGTPAVDVRPDVGAFFECGEAQVAGALAAAGGARVRECLHRQKFRSCWPGNTRKPKEHIDVVRRKKDRYSRHVQLYL